MSAEVHVCVATSHRVSLRTQVPELQLEQVPGQGLSQQCDELARIPDAHSSGNAAGAPFFFRQYPNLHKDIESHNVSFCTQAPSLQVKHDNSWRLDNGRKNKSLSRPGSVLGFQVSGRSRLYREDMTDAPALALLPILYMLPPYIHTSRALLSYHPTAPKRDPGLLDTLETPRAPYSPGTSTEVSLPPIQVQVLSLTW